MRTKWSVLLVLVLLLSACTAEPTAPAEGAPTEASTEAPAAPTEAPRGESPTEPPRSCTPVLPLDRPGENPYESVVEEFSLVAPSGNRIHGLVRRPDPDVYPDSCFAAVVVVPGAIMAGRMLAYDNDARLLAEAGIVVVTFNAEGRVGDEPEDVASEGSEDYNGFRHQEGLCAIVEWVMELDYVTSDNVGLWSYSYGVTMAAGCAGRHPEIPIRYLVDSEGPTSSYVTCHEPRALDDDPSNDRHEVAYSIVGHYSTHRDPSADNLAFWEEREAIRFIGDFRGRYLRLQGEWDHTQPPERPRDVAAFTLPPDWWQNKHATDMVNAAIAGGVPWVRVNLPEQGNRVNATYDQANPPVYVPGWLDDAPWGVRGVIEMARMR